MSSSHTHTHTHVSWGKVCSSRLYFHFYLLFCLLFFLSSERLRLRLSPVLACLLRFWRAQSITATNRRAAAGSRRCAVQLPPGALFRCLPTVRLQCAFRETYRRSFSTSHTCICGDLIFVLSTVGCLLPDLCTVNIPLPQPVVKFCGVQTLPTHGALGSAVQLYHDVNTCVHTFRRFFIKVCNLVEGVRCVTHCTVAKKKKTKKNIKLLAQCTVHRCANVLLGNSWCTCYGFLLVHFTRNKRLKVCNA